jgi:hypothetical protein
MMTVTEAELQEQVRLMCAQLGLYHFHPHDSRRSQAGWPDSVIIGPDGTMLFRELKTASGQLSSDQKRVAYLLKAGGHDFQVWRPADLIGGHIGAQLASLAGHRLARMPAAGPVAAREAPGGPGAGGG